MCTFQMKAQDPIITQFYLVPEVLNPAFTGMSNAWSAGIVHRRQWPNGNTKMDTQYAYANNLISDKVGLGISVMNHTEVFTNYNYFKFNGVFAYITEIRYDWKLRLGIEGGFGRKDFNFSNLLLEDQININTGEISNNGSIDPTANDAFNKINFLDFTGGIAFDNRDTWIGMAIRHINRPDISFNENGNIPLNMFLTLHGGHFIDLQSSPSGILPKNTSLLLAGNYMRQAQYNRLDVAGVLDMGAISLGLILASNPEGKSSRSHLLTSISPIVSFRFGEFTMGYSHDFNLSKLTRNYGIHEFSLVWQSSRKCDKCESYISKLKRGNSTLLLW